MRALCARALSLHAGAAALLGLATVASGQDGQRLPPPSTATVSAQWSTPAIAGRDVPEPPDAMYQGPPKVQSLVPASDDPGLPQPQSPPTEPGSTADPLDAPGDFQFYYRLPVQPSGAAISTGLIEPAATINRDVALYTGNSFAALSRDSGRTWTHVSPFTRFAALDGGFCCDQRVVQVTSPNMTVWLLEYRYSASTGRGSLRIACALGRDDLRDDRWLTFVLEPQTFGFGTGYFLDFSDIAFSADHLYGSCILANSSNNTAADLILWRARLDDIADGGGIGLGYYKASTIGGFGSFRFAHGCASTMYFAAHESTTQLRVYSWGDSAGAASIFSRTVPGWSGSATPAPGPDGRDWTGFGYTVNTVLAGFRRSESEIGFMWTSGAVAGRPSTFVRICRFDPSNGMALLGTDDIWSNGTAWHFPSAAVNSRGDVGGTICFGGGGSYPSASAFVIDQYRNYWAPLGNYLIRSGEMGPGSNRWGDYFHAERNSNYPLTFVGTGFVRRADGSGLPYYTWFGREETAPQWILLDVQSEPVGATIDLAQADRLGRTGGTANYQREYPRNQAYTLTAPATRSISAATWLFHRWRYRVSPTGAWQYLTVGETQLANDTIGSVDDTAVAEYLASRRLTINSVNPSSRVPIAVTPLDFNGRGDGSTSFTRDYYDGAVVTLTAPTTSGYNRFRHWTLDGVVQAPGTILGLRMDGARTAVAVYYENVAGSTTSIGAGCQGSNGLVPVHDLSWPSGQQGPQQGTPTTYRLADARPTTSVALNVGLSNRVFAGMRLPLDLGVIGVTGCALYHDIVSSQALATGRLGTASFPVTWPRDPAAIGVAIFSSFVIIDPGVRRPLPLTLSNAMQLRLGGDR